MTAAESLSIDSSPFKKSLQAKELPVPAGMPDIFKSITAGMPDMSKSITAGMPDIFKSMTASMPDMSKSITAGMPDMSKSIKEAELRLIGIQQGAEAEKNARKESAKLLTVAATSTTSGTTPITTGIDAKAIAPVAPKFDKSKFTMPTMDQLTIGPDGMPKISAKPQAQTIPAAVKPAEKPASPGKKINEETGEEYTPVGDAKKADKKTATLETKTTTLDDVAKLLTSLNTTMKQIASEASETNNRLGQQVKATKRMSGNLHGAS